MASADLLRIEEFYSSLFDSAKGNPSITRKVLKDSDTNFAPKLAKCGIFFLKFWWNGRR